MDLVDGNPGPRARQGLQGSRDPLKLEARVDLWDGVLFGLRSYFQQEGLREVSTPVRIPANAVEPFIEPISCEGGFLQTSPELAMKGLLRERSLYQIAHCFRQGENGPQHREEFHLIEWYRVGGTLAALQLDIERMVELASHSASVVLQEDCPAPRHWVRVGWLDLFEQHTGVALRGDESAQALEPLLDTLRAELNLSGAGGQKEEPRGNDDGVRDLAAWVELFSLWSDTRLDPWLAQHSLHIGVHLVDFPAPLAALSRTCGSRAMRFESYFLGSELANAYDELRDAEEQQSRFLRVNGLRRSLEKPELPLCERFLEHLQEQRLPACVGAAMGLERLLSTVCRRSHLSQIELREAFAGAPQIQD